MNYFHHFSSFQQSLEEDEICSKLELTISGKEKLNMHDPDASASIGEKKKECQTQNRISSFVKKSKNIRCS